MKFLLSEYQSIVAAIVEAGLMEQDFSFVKKRGHLYVNHLAGDVRFGFIRKTTTILNDDKQWAKVVEYKYGCKKSESKTDSWEIALASFQAWLKTLS